MNTYIGIDISPSSITTCLINSTGETISSVTVEVSQLINGWQFQNPETTLNTVIDQLTSISRANQLKVRSLGIACSSGLIMAWENASLEPLTMAVPYNFLSSDYLPQDTGQNSIRELDKAPGNILLSKPWESEDRFYPATVTSSGINPVVGPIESWLFQVLSSSKSAAIDHSTAESLPSPIELDKLSHLLPDSHPFRTGSYPSSVDSVGKIGEISHGHLTPISGVPITALVDKKGALLIANNCVKPGSSLLTTDDIWTLHVNTGEQHSKSPKPAQLAWTNPDSEPVYTCPILLDLPTKTLSWILDNLKIAKNQSELSKMASRIRSSEHVVILPYLKRSPSSNHQNEFSLLISGIGVTTTKNHLARATFESLAVQIATIVTEFRVTTENRVDHLVIDGKLSPFTVFLQMISEQTQLICTVHNKERTPALGAALLSAIGIGDMTFGSLSFEESSIQTINPSNNKRAAAIKAARYKNFAQKLEL